MDLRAIAQLAEEHYDRFLGENQHVGPDDPDLLARIMPHLEKEVSARSAEAESRSSYRSQPASETNNTANEHAPSPAPKEDDVLAIRLETARRLLDNVIQSRRNFR